MEIISIIAVSIGLPSCIIAVYQIRQSFFVNNRNAGKFKGTNKSEHVQSMIGFRDDDSIIRSYSNVLQISGLKFAYIPLIASWDKDQNEYRYGEVSVSLADYEYKIPEDFMMNFYSKPADYKKSTSENTHEEKVRLSKYTIKINAGNVSNELNFVFSKITYRDFLITNNSLDDVFPNTNSETFRKKYFPENVPYNPEVGLMSNICGVGVFIITSDNKIILTQASESVTVGAGLWGYSASGTIDWSVFPHPFLNVMRECEEEIGHIINVESLCLFSFGLDAEKAYYQFSFYEKTAATSKKILANCRMAKDFAAETKDIIAVDFEYSALIERLGIGDWNGIAAAGLMTLCTKFFEKKHIEHYLDPNEYYVNYREEMKKEWDQRAQRPGKLAVLSNRFPITQLDNISDDYIRDVLGFIGLDLKEKTVLEIGCGIGLLTRHFVKMAKELTCIDISAKMIARNKVELADDAPKIIYKECFFQDFNPHKKYNSIISSLVLIHNVEEDALQQMTDNMKKLSNVIFLFEQVDTGIQNSIHSNAKKESEYLQYFKEYRVANRIEHFLFTDTILFLKLVRKN